MESLISSFCSLSLDEQPRAPPPSPPSTPTSSQIKSDVFLSFRGEDTRDNFTSHLHQALVDKQIVTFIDYKLNRGDEISPALLKAIEESQIAIIIFSQNYANSRWCLEELVKILECREKHRQIVIPVFYKIDPSAVRNQTGSFEVAFAKHQSSKKNSSRVPKWRHALNTAGNISGFDSSVVTPEAVLIKQIVQKVLEDLKRQNSVSPSVDKKLVGMESMIKDIELLLGTGDQIQSDVRKVGIWGIGGIGKTTLAKAVYKKIFSQFEGFHFIESVREALEKQGPNRLRQELCLAILGDENAYNYQFTRSRFRRMKLLIILDDVTSVEQVENLIGDLDCFSLGSRIIITSRDQQVLKCYEMDHIYEVKELSLDNALNLLCQYAFKQNCPQVGYRKLSESVVKKVRGVPLALRVLGSFLFDKEKEVWVSSIKKLENSLDDKIYKVLKISYDGLDVDQQNVFLDITHFFKGWNVQLVTAFMDACGFHAQNAFSALTDKSLIIISHNVIMMHDLLQAMGKTIVRQKSIDPGKRTRLCNHDDIHNVLTHVTGTKKIEGISWDMSNTRDIHLHPEAFVNMPRLRFLRFYMSNCQWYNNNNKVHVLQDLKFCTELRYFEWVRCPLKSLQSISYSTNLVTLKLPSSNVEQLWSGVQQFNHLKEIVLDSSEKLIRLPDLRAPKLEKLNLNRCTSLIEIPQLPKSLKYADLKGCSKVQRLPELPDNLERLTLKHCSSLIEIPQLPKSLKYADLEGFSKFQRLPELPDNLECLKLKHCSSLIEIPQLPKSLKDADLEGCLKFQRLPELPDNLECLTLNHCSSLIEIPSSIQHLTSLNSLNLCGCKSLTSIPDCTGLISLEELDLSHCSELERLPDIPNNVTRLDFECCSSLIEIPSSIQHLTSLNYLNLYGCKSLTSIPDCTGLISLEELYLSYCSELERLPDIPNNVTSLDFECCSKLQRLSELSNSLEYLDVKDCPSLIEIPSSIQHLTRLKCLSISDCESLISIPDCTGLISLRVLCLSNCSKLERLPYIPNNLVELNLSGCSKLQRLPALPNNLQFLNLEGCSSLIEIPTSIQHLISLRCMYLCGCESLTSIPDCTDLISLKVLDLSYCSKLEMLPIIPNNIYLLDLSGCTSLSEIPSYFKRLNELRLTLSGLERLKVLPKLPWADIDASSCTSLQELSCPSFPNDFFALDGPQFKSFTFVNCFKLDRNSLNSFMEDTQREIKAQSPSFRQVYEGKGPPFRVCYPGNEIPEWFNFQNTGSFIGVELPLDRNDCNFLCFALCAVVSFADQFETSRSLFHYNVEYKCNVKSKEGGHNWNGMNGAFYFRVYGEKYCLRSSHVFIGFGFHFFRDLHDNEFTFQFDGPKDCDGKVFKVEKCGVHLVFGKNVENPKRKCRLTNSKEEDEPLPKRSKHIQYL